jgi:hypothetical protein
MWNWFRQSLPEAIKFCRLFSAVQLFTQLNPAACLSACEPPGYKTVATTYSKTKTSAPKTGVSTQMLFVLLVCCVNLQKLLMNLLPMIYFIRKLNVE